MTSPPVRMTAAAEPSLPLVTIAATQRIAEESSAPLRRLPLRGAFTISRTGSTNSSLSVFVQYSGLANPDEDYPRLPFLATIPAGASSTTIEVIPKPDDRTEGIETLVATISNCPPRTVPPMEIPCQAFETDPSRESATVFIRDDGVTTASVVITSPKDGDRFREGDVIKIDAVAIDLDSYISRVEFWDSEKLIGVSQINFFRAPDPGTPVWHSFEWKGAAAGEHLLTARASNLAGDNLKSPPIPITVGLVTNRPPSISLVKPASGATFAQNSAIEISAEGVDPDGYIPKVDFFADGRKIGEVNIDFFRKPDPGQKQTFEFTWRSPEPGAHQLTARATDDADGTTLSTAVPIEVARNDLLSLVNVVARDAFAMEPRTNSATAFLNTASFLIRRTGPTNASLTVSVSLSGTAQNKVDYEALSEQVTIPAGKTSATVVVRPLPDTLVERVETVVLQLEEPVSSTDTKYHVGNPHRAVALIFDNELGPVNGGGTRLPDGSIAMIFDADGSSSFRLEASSDLRNWETVCDALGGDASLQFVDENARTTPRRFYRLVMDPSAALGY